MEGFIGILVMLLGIYMALYGGNIEKKKRQEAEREEKEQLLKLKKQEAEREEKEDDELKEQLGYIVDFFNDVQQLKKTYFTYSESMSLISKYRGVCKYFMNKKLIGEYKQLSEFMRIYPNLEIHRNIYNQEFVKKQLSNSDKLLSNIDGKSLDPQQRKAVIIDEDNNLVVAGAGSGKTLTIAGKVTYLVNLMKVKPEEILLITFTKKASEEMEERVVKKLGIPVKVSTFHALGLTTITKGTKKKPTIDDNPDKILDVYFREHIFSNIKVMTDLVTFFGNYLHVPKEVAEFKDYGEYLSAQKHISLDTLKGICRVEKGQDRVTLNNERVKSIEELNIANFLFLSGIKYEYEREYKYQTNDEDYRQYKPDFYLSDYDIYIEHFGVNKNMQTPWLPPIEAEKYRNGMKWKRDLHKKNNTVLYETYSYQFQEGTILKVLKSDLTRMGVKFNGLNNKEIKNCMTELVESKTFGEFRKLIATFLTLFKSNGYEEEEINKMLIDNKNKEMAFLRQRNELFLSIFRDIFKYYQNFLQSKKRIDFNDMINEATNLVLNDKAVYPYKYIIIDEYQDISQARFKLIKAIKSKTNAKIMAVGDDWQSIYRFAGSDIMLFTQFEIMFGKSELLKIENTYRNSQQLIDLAGKFVMENPLQIKKQLKSKKSLDVPVAVLGYSTSLEYAVIVTLRRLSKDNQKKNILILGRNNFDIKPLEESMYFDVKITAESTKIKCVNYPDLDIVFMTVHRSKGLEADEVIIINCKNDLLGFPNQISDDLVLDFVLTKGDDYLYGEERRLWYVALTRTRNRCILLAPTSNASIFVNELLENYNVPFKEIEKSEEYNIQVRCPRCKSGLLVKRAGAHDKEFLGCNNYPGCDYTFKDLGLLNKAVKCPICGGYMIKRKGKFGEFYGCSNYPLCRATKEVEVDNNESFKEVKSKKCIIGSIKSTHIRNDFKTDAQERVGSYKNYVNPDNTFYASFIDNEIKGLYEEFGKSEPKRVVKANGKQSVSQNLHNKIEPLEQVKRGKVLEKYGYSDVEIQTILNDSNR